MTLQKDKFYIFATQFDDVGGEGDGIRICDLVTGEIPYGTEIQVMNMALFDTSYDLFRYLEEAYDESQDDFVPGWGDKQENLATRRLAPGTAFWIKPTGTFTATVAGQVLADSSKQIDFTANKFTLFANPFPVAANPNDYTWSNLTYGDEIQVLNTAITETSYNLYRYLEEAYDADKDDFVPGWGNKQEDLVTTGIIPVAQGAWMKAQKAATLKWTSPFEK